MLYDTRESEEKVEKSLRVARFYENRLTLPTVIPATPPPWVNFLAT